MFVYFHFILLLILFLNFSFGNIQQLNDQNFSIKRYSEYINLKNIYINENKKLIEISVEFNSIITNKGEKLIISPINEDSDDNENTKIYSLENVGDKIIKLQFIETLNINYRRGIEICLLEKKENGMEICEEKVC